VRAVTAERDLGGAETWGEPWVEHAIRNEVQSRVSTLLLRDDRDQIAEIMLAARDALRERDLTRRDDAQDLPDALPARLESLADLVGEAYPRRATNLRRLAARLRLARSLRARLATTRVLYRAPDALSLYAFPYPMRPGQSPRDLVEGAGRATGLRLLPSPPDRALGRLWLGSPGWWGGFCPAEIVVASEYLSALGDVVPNGPGEWSRVQAAPWYEPPSGALVAALLPLVARVEQRGAPAPGPWDELGTHRAPLPPCPSCGGRLGSHFERAWCADCDWSGPTPSVDRGAGDGGSERVR
jgi:hypothetical protein